MRLLSDVQPSELKGKRVLVRVGFNVPIKDVDTKQKFRIEAAKKTVNFLIDAGAQIALLTHLGRPDGWYSKELSLEQLTDDVQEILGHFVVFSSGCVGESVENILKETPKKSVILLENVRFHADETSKDKKRREQFAKKITAPFDIFISDAFSVAHREHASIVECAEALPSYAGIHFEQEIETLSHLRSNPISPAIAIIGGSKIETKLPLIRALESRFDTILVGGKVANEALDAKIEFSDKVIFPQDFIDDRYDIGPETTRIFIEKIITARTVLWNGPVGWYEKSKYEIGTKRIVQALTETKAKTIVGGGESIEALEHYNAMDKITFVSTAGGAMLQFMTGEKLPGMEII